MSDKNITEVNNQQDSVTIKVKSQDQDEIHFKIKKSMALKKLMEKYCERINILQSSANFVFEGEKIYPHQTPEDLNLQDEDEIQVIVEQIGGSFKQFQMNKQIIINEQFDINIRLWKF